MSTSEKEKMDENDTSPSEKLDDTCDALAIAVCHAHTGKSRLKQFYNIK